MTPAVTPLLSFDTLWDALTEELINLYDAHHVCVAAAQAIASYLSVPAIVFLRSPLDAHHNVWICNPDQRSQQFRWEDDNQVLTSLMESGNVANLPIDKFPAELFGALDSAEILVAPFYKSWYGMAPQGALAVVTERLSAEIDPKTFSSLANYITTYLERAFLRYRTEQQEIVFDVVNDITLSLTATLSLEDIFDKVANPIRRIMNAESVSIGLYDNETDEIVFVRELLGPLFHDLPTIRLKPGQGIGGWVLQNKKAVLVKDVYNDDRFSSMADESSGFKTQTILCVPLTVEDRVIGVLQSLNKQVGSFDSADLNLLQAIANPLAIALENASLHNDMVAEKRRIETIFDSMSEGMLTTDGNGIITGMNGSLRALLQIDSAEIERLPAHEMLQARRHDLPLFIEQVLMSAPSDSPTLACEVFAEFPSDAVPVLISGANIHDENGKLTEAIFVFSDLREIREIERMRDDFFTNIVHELRTPLATILLYARMLKKGVADTEKSARFLNTIEHESDRLQAMVRQMLALAKMEASETERSKSDVNINALLTEIINPLRDAARVKGLDFIEEIADDLPTIHGDRERLYSAFKNLIDNAIKFTQEGSVTVKAWRDADSAENPQLHVVIADQGIGIPETGLPNLFRRFYRAQTAVEHGIAGTGLGLYMVKEGVEKHRGTVTVDSTVGKGTSFTIRLPLSN